MMKRESRYVRVGKVIGLTCLAALLLRVLYVAVQGSPPAVPETPVLPQHQGAETSSFTVEITLKNKGTMRAEIHPGWAPIGVKRFRTLVESGYYTNTPVFRVIRGFMAQFGIADDPKVSKKWERMAIPDDPQVHGVSNLRGYISFANKGPNSRTAQLFINFGDNHFLDRQHFTPIGKVVDADLGLLGRIHVTGEGAPQGPGPNQGKIYALGGDYIRQKFPKIDWIESIKIVS